MAPLATLSRVSMQDPPFGSFNSEALSWKQGKWYNKPYEGAEIPKNRLSDFLRGEGDKFLTEFYVAHTAKPKEVRFCPLLPG